ncbi:MAG: aminotransferase class I/II-fold pyridoxal phosphate-dependent enzyme, partial [bacterium]
MKDYLGEYDNLIILKAFTKLYGMAGVRLGYCLCASGEMAEDLRKAGPPWNVSNLAQAAGIAALEDGQHAAEGRKIVAAERQYLKDALRQLGYSRVYGEANYLLFNGPDELDEVMRDRGILIRNCDNYHGLGKGWFRIAVKKHEENQQLIDSMKDVLEK